MKNFLINLFFLVQLLSLLKPTASQSDGEIRQEIKDSFIDQLDLKYLGIFDGPAVLSPTPYMPDAEGTPDLSRPIQFINYFMAGYKIMPKVSIGCLITLGYYPFVNQQNLSLFDPAFRLTHRGLFKGQNFKTVVDLRFFIPTTEFSKKAEMITSVQSFQMTEYTFSESHWTIGSLSSFKFGFYNTLSHLSQSWSIYLAPNLNYYITDHFSFSLFTGATVSHYPRSEKEATVLEDPYFGPGLNLSMNDSLTISPAFIAPPHAFRFKNISLLVFIVGKVF